MRFAWAHAPLPVLDAGSLPEAGGAATRGLGGSLQSLSELDQRRHLATLLTKVYTHAKHTQAQAQAPARTEKYDKSFAQGQKHEMQSTTNRQSRTPCQCVHQLHDS